MYTSEQFYTKFARSYDDYAAKKEAYICAVNNFIKNETGLHKKMIDVGSGTGLRSKKIADLTKATSLFLIDNSEGMISLSKEMVGLPTLHADISDSKFKSNGKYETVMCLWNVLGHIPTEDKRKIALINLAKLMEDDGLLFIDVNNRYNISNYGIKAVMVNICKDIFNFQKNGDFELDFDTKNGKIQTEVHIFNPFEINQLIKTSGLKIIKKQIINYRTGNITKNIFGGQLVYKLSKQ